MRTVAICFATTDLNKGPALPAADLHEVRDFASHLSEKGATIYAVRSAAYLENNDFAYGARFENGNFAPVNERITADVIFTRTSHFYPDSQAHVINQKEFDLLFNNKMFTAVTFAEFSPYTTYVGSAGQLGPALERVSTDLVVAKYLESYGGKGVFIETKDAIGEQIAQFPVLLQEFVDTSSGIPGQTHCVSDIRAIVTGRKTEHSIILLYYRTPANNSLMTNQHQGGSINVVPPDQWPRGVLELVHAVDERFSRYNERYYCIDCGLGPNGRWQLYEVNVPPALMTVAECGQEATRYFDGLCDLFLF